MRLRITYANVVATLALFLALGGGAYALTVSGEHVVNGSLSGKDIKNDSIKPRDVDGLPASTTVRTGTPQSGTIAAGATASCKSAETLLSGGYVLAGNTLVSTIADNPQPVRSGPVDTWVVEVAVDSPSPGDQFTITPYALCAS